jgi:drug/metabolite transporter (DMT)-like permease
MLLALRFASAAAVALLLSLEVAATALLGALAFRDPLGRRGWLGVAAAVAAGVVLAWGGGVPGAIAALLVAAACLGWALDNHLTALIDTLPPVGTTLVKGAVAGATNLLLAAWLTPAWPSLVDAAAALAIGGACYGISIALYVHAAQRLGAVRAQALFATAPFWGVALAAALRGDRLSVASLVAIALAATAAGLILRDQHAHRHRHEALAHAHRHRHDDGHHDHPHPGLPPDVEHTHPHVHEAVEHSHRHVPDLHHRHRHGTGA